MVLDDQLDLFRRRPVVQRKPPHAPYQPGSQTSKDAATDIVPRLHALEELTLECFRRAGDEGLTDAELMGLPVWAERDVLPETARPRRVRLVQSGILMDSKRKRLTPRRRAATVWILNPHRRAAERIDRSMRRGSDG